MPCFLVFTLTPASAPHTEPVPFALTWTFPTGSPLQNPLARMVLCFRSVGVQPARGWFTHSPSWMVHFLPLAVWQTLPPFVTGPFVCWNSTRHSLLCASARGAPPRTLATSTATAPVA